MSSTHGPEVPPDSHEAPGSAPPGSPPAAERAKKLSDLPPAAGAERLAAQLLDESDIAFVTALRNAGLAPDLTGEELLRVATSVGDAKDLTRRVDLLQAYYEAGGDERLSRTRRQLDRFLVHAEGEAATAGDLLDRLAEIAPEIGEISLERVGGSEDGPLVLRAGDHMAALLDEIEENLDTDEIDLRELEEQRRLGVTMVTLRGLVRATNVLLDRFGIRERLVPVGSDDEREVYIGLPLTEAIELTRGGYLDEEDPAAVMELGCW